MIAREGIGLYDCHIKPQGISHALAALQHGSSDHGAGSCAGTGALKKRRTVNTLVKQESPKVGCPENSILGSKIASAPRSSPWRRSLAASLLAIGWMGCGTSSAQDTAQQTTSPPTSKRTIQDVKGRVGEIQTSAGSLNIEKLADGLVHPWGMAFLPDSRLLITERPGRLRILSSSGELSAPLEGVPEVVAQGQGGLLDVAIGPDFAETGHVYLGFSEPGEGGASTAFGRGRLGGGKLDDFNVIFRQEPKVEGPNHFGGRIVFAPDGNLFLLMGERFKFDPAQDLSDHLGTIVRIKPDGSVPPDNPFVGRPDARDEIWSYGHRNIESAAIYPGTDQLWVAEFGPLGGDELNLPEAGKNYGWPEVCWGRHYDGRDIPDPPTRPEFAASIKQWTPVISPSGMAVYTGDVFSEWRGSVLIGGLSSKALIRVKTDGKTFQGEERIPLGARIRDVEQGPDGLVYLLTDQEDGNLWRLVPAE